MNFFLVTLFGFFLAVQASPLSFASRAAEDVFVPHINSPNGSTIWCIGQTETVEWETDNAPVNISNGAAIYLSYPGNFSSAILLAKGFNLRSGRHNVVVPANTTPGQYQITLFGDSGDQSQTFSIQQCVGQT